METKITLQPIKYIPIHIDTIQPNEPLPCDLYLKAISRGKVTYSLLKREGERLEVQEKERLLQENIPLLFIRDSEIEKYERYLNRLLGMTDPESRSVLLYQRASLVVRELFEEPLSQFPFLRALWAVDELIKSMVEDEKLLSNLFELMSYDYHTYTHCVNVCLLSLGFSIHLDLRDSMRDIGLGSLLHDIGKRMIDREILEKPGPLTDEEWEQMKKHPLYSFEMLRDVGNVSWIACDIALQHHEKMDGSGYPRGLRGAMIHRFSRMVCIADVFDALTSRRPYREGMRLYDALMLMAEEMGGKLDRELLREFILFLSELSGIKGRG